MGAWGWGEQVTRTALSPRCGGSVTHEEAPGPCDVDSEVCEWGRRTGRRGGAPSSRRHVRSFDFRQRCQGSGGQHTGKGTVSEGGSGGARSHRGLGPRPPSRFLPLVCEMGTAPPPCRLAVGKCLRRVTCPLEPAGKGGRSWDQPEQELGHRADERPWERPVPAGLSSGVYPEGTGRPGRSEQRCDVQQLQPGGSHRGAGLGPTRGAEPQVGESAWWGGLEVPQILRVTRAEWGPEDVPGKPFPFCAGRTLTLYKGLGAGWGAEQAQIGPGEPGGCWDRGHAGPAPPVPLHPIAPDSHLPFAPTPRGPDGTGRQLMGRLGCRAGT